MRSLIGKPVEALDTPALLVDLDGMAENIARISGTCRENGVNWRPHTKGNKTIEIVRQELAAGAIGITCAKLGEAEVMAPAVPDILIANQIVGAAKIRRLVQLPRSVDAIVAVDDPANVAELAAAARAHGRRQRVVIEVNIGMNRAGVAPGGPVVELARVIAAHGGLEFAGLMGWESQATRIPDASEKEPAVAEAIGRLTASADACRAAGYDVRIVSCGGTGTFPYCVQQPGVTEVQVGGGIFGDVHYRDHYHEDFRCALTVLATVTSRPTPTRIILDAGRKTLSSDAAMPEPLGLTSLRSIKLSAEHATIELEAPNELPRAGDKLAFIVGYSDTTVHLHEEIVGVRNGKVEAIWRVVGRGKIK
ncbi:MAG TPA: alanine racemase [Acetobacteraceae bacterium]|jgi:D-serine deaminase-like pyridoxal phosphate-dependent protein|nr:alanine racemase [Acetobacteraceae bacterium]